MSYYGHLPGKVPSAGKVQNDSNTPFGDKGSVESCTFGASAGQRSNVRIEVGLGQFYYISPAPMISMSSNELFSGDTYVGSEYKIDLTGYMFAGACKDVEGDEQSRNTAYIGNLAALIGYCNDIRSVQIFANPAAANPTIAFAAESASISIEETTLYNASRYTLSINGYYRGDVAKSTISSISDNIETSENYDIGGPSTGGVPYNFSRTVTVTARPGRNHGDNFADIQDTAWNIMNISSGAFPTDWAFANLVFSESIDRSSKSASVSANGYVLDLSNGGTVGDGYFAKFTSSANYDRGGGGGSRTATVDCSIIGYHATYWPEGAKFIPYISAREAENGYNHVSDNAKFGSSSQTYKIALRNSGGFLNYDPSTISVKSGGTPGTIDFSVTYDSRPYNIFYNAIAENITVTDTYPGDTHAKIQIPGRAYELIQYMNSMSSYERDVTIEITIDPAFLPAGDSNSIFMTGPSINVNSGPLKNVVSSLQPDGHTVMQKPPQESWNPKTGVYTLNIGWIYQY